MTTRATRLPKRSSTLTDGSQGTFCARGGQAPPGLILYVFVIAFFIILFYSSSPTVYAGDSSLFSAASYLLGTAHPPAYPAFVLFGKLATFLPLGNIAFKVNFLSALFGALAAALAFEATYYLTGNKAASLLGPMATLSSPLFLLESSKAEAYSLNAFLIMLLFYLGLRAIRKNKCFKEILLSFFILGLGMGNHQTIGFMLFLLLVVVVLRRRDLPRTTLPLGGILFAAGFSVYLYLYFRSTVGTSLDYSKVSSFSDFLIVFFRLGYDGNTVHALKGVSSNGGAWLYAGKNMGLLLFGEISVIALMLAPLGIAKSFRERRVFLYLIVSVIIWLPLAKMTFSSRTLTQEQMSISGPYFLQIIPIISTASALGMHACIEFIIVRSAFVARGAAAALLVFQLVLVPEAAEKSSLSDYYISYAWTKDVSRVLKPRSFFLAFGDNPIFLSFYGFGVERLRDDVLVMNDVPGGDAFGLTIAPRQKFSALYPDFYSTTGIGARFFYPLAEQGRLYTSSRGSVSTKVKWKLVPTDYVITKILLPEGSDYPIRESFKEAFDKIDYVPVVRGHKKDLMTSEINYNYAITAWLNARLLAMEDNEKAGSYYRLAFLLATGDLKYTVIRDYIMYIAWKRGTGEALVLISELGEGSADEKSREVASKIKEWFKAEMANTPGPVKRQWSIVNTSAI